VQTFFVKFKKIAKKNSKTTFSLPFPHPGLRKQQQDSVGGGKINQNRRYLHTKTG
jgi:hypothetical protein